MDLDDVQDFFIRVQKQVSKNVTKLKEKVAIYEEPHSELSHTSDFISLMVRLPHVNKRSITLTVGKSSLQIRGMKKQRDLAITELPQVYHRSIKLPPHAKTDRLKIRFKNDILHVRIPLEKLQS